MEILVLMYSVIAAILWAHRDKLAIDGNLKDKWHAFGFALRFYAVGGLVFGMLFHQTPGLWEILYLITIGGLMFWTVFDPYLNYIRGKDINHLGSNALDRLLQKAHDHFSLDAWMVKALLLGLVIGSWHLLS